MKQKINLIEDFVKNRMKEYDSGHDWWHIVRVRKLAHIINEMEVMADPVILDIAALLHDTVDSKFAGNDSKKGYFEVSEFLENIGLTEIREQIIDVIKNVSFSNNKKSGNLSDPVLLIVQDADKLDALGAIGIARAFNYGGFRNNPIYIPGRKSNNRGKTTIGHFYDKLLILKEMMNTSTGRKLAEERHVYLEKFLEQFFKEWDVEG